MTQVFQRLFSTLPTTYNHSHLHSTAYDTQQSSSHLHRASAASK